MDNQLQQLTDFSLKFTFCHGSHYYKENGVGTQQGASLP
jgi:hypothetical protein